MTVFINYHNKVGLIDAARIVCRLHLNPTVSVTKADCVIAKDNRFYHF